jgi:flagellar L-ring protein precursor FlgH
MKPKLIAALLVLACAAAPAGARGRKKQKPPERSALDRYIEQATASAHAASDASPGSLWSSTAPFLDLARDVRASRVDDTVTVLVAENASAVSSGDVQSARTSSAKSSVAALAGVTKAAGPLANLLGVTGDQQLKGAASTSRQAVLSTVLGTRVVQVLPNGNLVVEGVKEIRVSAEQQVIMVRGVVRPADLSADNVVRSDRIAQLEVSVNGKGVVGDAVRRPFFLYRLLLGLLPF